MRWLELLLTGGGFVALLKFAQWAMELRHKSKTKSITLDGIDRLRRVYLIMEDAIQDSETPGEVECGRVVLFSAHNSGGVPSPAAPFYVSAMHWVTARPDQRKVIGSYVNIKVDRQYIEMLQSIQQNGRYRLSMEQNSGSILREYYEAEGIKDGVMFFLGIRDNRFVFMSFCSFDGLFTNNQITRFSLLANEIKNVMESN